MRIAWSSFLLVSTVALGGCPGDDSSTDEGAGSDTAVATSATTATSMTSVDSGSGTGVAPVGCSAMTNEADCIAHTVGGDEGQSAVGCSWLETTIITDPATCASEPGGECTVIPQALDGCGGLTLPKCPGAEADPDGLMYFPTDDGFEIAYWVADDPCMPAPGVICDLEGTDDAALACNCACS